MELTDLNDGNQIVIAVIGLGYVGLPLACAFSKKYKTYGIDLNQKKIQNYLRFNDPGGGLESSELKKSIEDNGLVISTDIKLISEANVIIVAVPTPVDKSKTPDFSPLIKASQDIGDHLKTGSLVIYESTVYPGATEEICIPILERRSNLSWKKNFNVGYSPERINPGDKTHTLKNVIKIVSGDTSKTTEMVKTLYSSIVDAGVYVSPSIRVAEAAKVIENIQRDLNIALINELSILFKKLNIDTKAVLDAAGTKWNFLKFTPGLVGGHCIGVDPYYLTYKSEMVGYHPEIILAGRRINDGMPNFVGSETIRSILMQGGFNEKDVIIILGITFKEDCPDIRNSKVFDLICYFKDIGINVAVHDPIADPNEVEAEYNVKLCSWEELPKNASAVILSVGHKYYLDMSDSMIIDLLRPKSVIVDLKSALSSDSFTELGHLVWRL
jgi:UDP-N-acetyl-D-galactosamine dehydrogenase